MIMQYGKYKGWLIMEIPSDYLESLIQETHSKQLKFAIKEELEFRKMVEDFGEHNDI